MSFEKMFELLHKLENILGQQLSIEFNSDGSGYIKNVYGHIHFFNSPRELIRYLGRVTNDIQGSI